MADTPRVPLQGNIASSKYAPSVENSVGQIVIIASDESPMVVIDDDIENTEAVQS
jgi:hypothetical protein